MANNYMCLYKHKYDIYICIYVYSYMPFMYINMPNSI